MTRRDQKRIVREMAESLKAGLFNHIDSGRIPEDWDGHELRELFYQHACLFRSHIMQHAGNQRRRNYDNTVLVNNL